MHGPAANTHDLWVACSGTYLCEYDPDCSFENHSFAVTQGFGKSFGYNRNEDIHVGDNRWCDWNLAYGDGACAVSTAVTYADADKCCTQTNVSDRPYPIQSVPHAGCAELPPAGREQPLPARRHCDGRSIGIRISAWVTWDANKCARCADDGARAPARAHGRKRWRRCASPSAGSLTSSRRPVCAYLCGRRKLGD